MVFVVFSQRLISHHAHTANIYRIENVPIVLFALRVEGFKRLDN
jgi:hypothetical protein